MTATILRRIWVTFSAHIIGIYASIINRLHVVGGEHVPPTGGVLIASNHISAYDTIFLPWVIISRYPLQMLWAPAKEELFKSRFQRWLYGSWGAFPVRRGRDVRAGRVIKELLESQKVMLFPEGTRHRDGMLGKGNRGVGKIIFDTRAVVVPTALVGLNHWHFPGFGQKAKVVFGAPLDFTDLLQLPDVKETHQLIVDRVMSAIADQLKAEGAYVNEG